MHEMFQIINNYVESWLLIIFVLGVSIACTIALRFVQFRYFAKAWKYLFAPTEGGAKSDLTPFQAFMNTLSSNIGNGNIVGPAWAVYAGGPGSLFWMAVSGILLMAVRFSEVFLSLFFAQTVKPQETKRALGGPMLYLQQLPFGRYLSYIYAVFCLFYVLLFANSFQAQSISSALEKTWGVPVLATGIAIALFVIYLVMGNTQRIAKASETLVPVKVLVFAITTISVLVYHHAALAGAFKLIFSHAFTSQAIAGGALGFSIQLAMRFGMIRAVMAMEAGLGTAAIMFGFTGSKQPEKDAIMSMLSTFLTTGVCFISGLCIVVSGVWEHAAALNPANAGPHLVIEAFSTTFGAYGSWAVSFLAASFGLGVLAAVVYVVRELWLFLTGGRFLMIGMIIYVLFAFWGSISDARLVFDTGDLAVAVLLFINLFGILYLLPVARRGITQFMAAEKNK
jgi:AGCS family alanine or glycine:cation symporter